MKNFLKRLTKKPVVGILVISVIFLVIGYLYSIRQNSREGVRGRASCESVATCVGRRAGGRMISSQGRNQLRARCSESLRQCQRRRSRGNRRRGNRRPPELEPGPRATRGGSYAPRMRGGSDATGIPAPVSEGGSYIPRGNREVGLEMPPPREPTLIEGPQEYDRMPRGGAEGEYGMPASPQRPSYEAIPEPGTSPDSDASFYFDPF